MGHTGVSSLRLVELPGMEAGRSSWTALAERTGNVFSTWEWADAWWRHFGAGRRLALVQAVDELGRARAILPLWRERRGGVPLLRFLGAGVADQLGPVTDPADIPTAAAMLRSGTAGRGILLAERLAADRDWGTLLGGRVIRAEASPLLELTGTGGWEGYLSGRSANFRQEIRRRQRRLERLGVRYRLSADPGRLDRDFDSLMSLHAARWNGRSSAFAGARAAFHREFARRALGAGWLRLWVAESGGRAVAAWYGFRFGTAESYYMSGRDPAWDRYRLGAGILEHSIREAYADGMGEYRFLRGDEAYKYRYARAGAGVCTVVAGRGGAGASVTAVANLLARTRRGRGVLKRLGG